MSYKETWAPFAAGWFPLLPNSQKAIEHSQSCAVRTEKFQDTLAIITELFPIHNESISSEEKCLHHEVLVTYAHCVSRGPFDLGHAKGVQHHINAESAEPVHVPARRVPFHKRAEIQRQVEEMLMVFPVVLVDKPDGSQRFCVNYRALNFVRKRNLYLLPRREKIIESLADAKWFSHIDLRRSYWQVDVAEEDREKAAFATPDGLYKIKLWFDKCSSMLYENHSQYPKGSMSVRLSCIPR